MHIANSGDALMRIIAGETVYQAERARKHAALGVKMEYESAALCAWQVQEHQHGIRAAEIVESNYGYSLRHASGLDNWGLILSARTRELDGTLEAAVAAARSWCAVDPDRRYVFIQD